MPLVVACYREQPRIDYVAPTPSQDALPPSRIVAARFAHDDVGASSPADAVVVVFDRELDAASLVGRAFMVVMSDGSRVRAQQAVLAPASESDENRTVTLWGEFGDPFERPPTDVVVIERLWDEQGGPLLGSSGHVDVITEGPRPLLVMPGGHDCPEAQQSLRSYWTDTLLDVDDGDLEAVEVELADGQRVHPAGFGDVAVNGSDTVDDNVLDLCLRERTLARRVHWRAGSFRAPAGARNRDGALEVFERAAVGLAARVEHSSPT